MEVRFEMRVDLGSVLVVLLEDGLAVGVSGHEEIESGVFGLRDVLVLRVSAGLVVCDVQEAEGIAVVGVDLPGLIMGRRSGGT